MQATTIRCPACHHEFPLSTAMEDQLRERLRAEVDRDRQEQVAGLKRQAEKLAADQAAMARRDAEFAAQRTEWEQHVAQERERLAAAIQQGVAEARPRLLAELREQFAAEHGLQMKDLREQLAEKDARLRTTEAAELEFRKKNRELEERQRNFELEKQRQMDLERDQIRQETLKAAMDEHRLKELEKDKQLADLRRQLDEARRTAEQGSQQAQGEALELGLEAALRTAFPTDLFEPVAKGVRGADVLQRVRGPDGSISGAILWEYKNTKAWQAGWLPKLKDDQREAKADLAAIVTTALPKDLESFGERERVWVVSPRLATPLAAALRQTLIETAAARRAQEGRQEKMELLYDYLAGSGFKRRIEGIVEAFRTLHEGLDREKRAMAKIWAEREKLLERVIQNTAGLHGELGGIIGRALPAIELLELGAAAAERAVLAEPGR